MIVSPLRQPDLEGKAIRNLSEAPQSGTFAWQMTQEHQVIWDRRDGSADEQHRPQGKDSPRGCRVNALQLRVTSAEEKPFRTASSTFAREQPGKANPGSLSDAFILLHFQMIRATGVTSG